MAEQSKPGSPKRYSDRYKRSRRSFKSEMNSVREKCKNKIYSGREKCNSNINSWREKCNRALKNNKKSRGNGSREWGDSNILNN